MKTEIGVHIVASCDLAHREHRQTRVCAQINRFSSSDQIRRLRRFAAKCPDSVHYPVVDTIPQQRASAGRSDRMLTGDWCTATPKLVGEFP